MGGGGGGYLTNNLKSKSEFLKISCETEGDTAVLVSAIPTFHLDSDNHQPQKNLGGGGGGEGGRGGRGGKEGEKGGTNNLKSQSEYLETDCKTEGDTQQCLQV